MTTILPEFGTTSDGFLAVRLADMAYIARPFADQLRIASAWRLTAPIAEWTAQRFDGCHAMVAHEAGFRAWIEATAVHMNQREALGRKEVRLAVATPWGTSQGATIYAVGVVFHSTAGHGGFKLDRLRNAGVYPALRNAGGWYEEDAEWAKVAFAYPALFTDRERELAERSIKDWYPDAWEGVRGRRLAPEESFTRDRQRFEREHACDWVVIAAVRSDKHAGQVEAVASIGGRRGTADERGFLVPSGEYQAGRHGFVIDPSRHPALRAA